MRLNRTNERRGVILLVVLSLLTLFAIVGLTFVLYADSEATAARVAREAESQQHADVDPQQALSFFLGQLIYDVPDSVITVNGYGTGGAASGLRGHSLARTMYGYNSTTVNVTPFDGVGRLHTDGTNWPRMNPYPNTPSTDDYMLVNYTYFSGDGFSRDPEWYGPLQTTPPGTGKNAGATGTFYVGGNAPYTYPDLNNFFLAAVRSDGTLIAPSFHRNWAFGSLAQSNPNWTLPQGKYMTLRPRPAEHPGFPYPDDINGDVKNLVWATNSGNDSIWIDLGAPVMTAPDGTKFKMLFAPLIMDLDNRINLAAAGNIAGAGGNTHASNQGWGAWEVNLQQILNSVTGTGANEHQWLFQGRTINAPQMVYGKYGPNGLPNAALFPSGDLAHVYGQADLDGRNEMSANAPTGPFYLPGSNAAAPANTCFPYFPPGYGCGSAAERTNHPAGYFAFKSIGYSTTAAGNDDKVFRPSDMESILRPNSIGSQHPADSGSASLLSQLLRLCPQNLQIGNTAPQRRNWVTTLSADLAKPGLSPWIYTPLDASNTPLYTVSAPPPPPTPSPLLLPSGPAVSFPTLAQRQAALAVGSDFTANWRAANAALGRIDLNRSLPPFPHMLANTDPNYVAPNTRYDSNPNALAANSAFQLAMQARQQLALDIYTRLLAVTGVAPPSSVATPSVTDLAPRRWLAQLAVNIVDYIDADDISTPFNFYNTTNAAGNGLPPAITNYQVAANTTTVTPTTTTIPAYLAAGTVQGNPDVPTYWVFGTELPRIVINEVLGEYMIDTDDQTVANPKAKDNGNIQVKLFVELFNPMPTPGTVTTTAGANGAAYQPQDALPTPLYMPATMGGVAPGAYSPYQLLIANNGETTPVLAPAATTNPLAIAPTPIPYSNGLWYNVAGLNNNVLGTPQYQYYVDPITNPNPTTAGPPVTAGCDFVTGVPATSQVPTVGTIATPSYAIGGPTGGLYGGLGTQALAAGQSSMLLVGPPLTATDSDANNDLTVAAGVPATTPYLSSPSMTYKATYTSTATAKYPWSVTVPAPPGSAANTPATKVYTFDYINGVSVLLRRLVNPYLPPNPFLSTGGLLYSTLPPNPYVTVDYASGTPLNGYGLGTVGGKANSPIPLSGFSAPPYPYNSAPAPAGPASYGKYQPYAAYLRQVTGTNQVDATASQYAAQTTAMTTGTTNAAVINHHTLGSPNLPLASPFTWLVHLDRKLISPMELLHVSGFHPHELTQRFIIPSTIPDPTNAMNPPVPNPQLVPQPYNYTIATPANSTPFQHYVPWFNQPSGGPSSRLYRIFELLDTHDLASGVSPLYGRVPGKININTLWDPPTASPQIYQAICSPSSTPNNPNFTAANVNGAFQKLFSLRTTGMPVLGATDCPIVGMAAPFAPAAGDTQYPTSSGMGINRTLFTSGSATGNPATLGTPPALQIPIATPNPASIQTTHPYLQNELLTKIYNRLTTRSNVFAVFLTVGFFEVTGTVAGSNIPQLGAEIGRSEGRHIRHRMFALVDRTQLAAFSTTTTAASTPVVIPPNTPPWQTTSATITLQTPSALITNGTQLVIEPGTANEEVVTVTNVSGNQITANFTLPHPNSAVTGNLSPIYSVILRGNPGPQTVYDPRNDSLVVPYFSIID